MKASKGLTPIEAQQYEYKKFEVKSLFTKQSIVWWIFIIIFSAFGLVIVLEHDEIVTQLTPISQKIREIPGGFIIPILVFFIISFPPLFGHEIIAVLVGAVWGLWVGFAITAAGTFIGELGTWYAFRYVLRRRAEKLERTSLNYGALARLTRDGGFWIAFLIRLSLVPSHFSTAVFSTCNVKFWHFALATFLTLPKQITIVYLGVALGQEKQDKLTNGLVIGITFIITVIVGSYVYVKMRRVKKTLLAEQEVRMFDAKAARAWSSSEDVDLGGGTWTDQEGAEGDMRVQLRPMEPLAAYRPSMDGEPRVYGEQRTDMKGFV